MSTDSTNNFTKTLLSTSFQGSIFTIIWILIVSYLSYNIIYEANWIFTDNQLLQNRTAIGLPFLLTDFIMPSIMRFYPLSLQDFNILLFFFDTPSPFTHYAWIALTFALLAFLFASLLRIIEKNNCFSYSLYIASIFFTSFFFVQDLLIIYLDIIYAERVLLILLTAFMLSYFKALKTDKLIYYIFAIFMVALATYHKEPVFGAFLVIALFNLIFYFRKITLKHKVFNVFLIINAIVFLLLLYKLVYVHTTERYGNWFTGSYFDLAEIIFMREKVLLAGLILGLVRGYFILFKKDQMQHSFYDSVLFAGLAYAFAYVILKLPFQYYVLPAIYLMFPPLFYWTLQSYKICKYLPLCLALLMGLTPIYYFEAQGDFISSYHTRRMTDMPQVENLLSLKEQGFEFVYVIQPMVLPENQGNVFRGYHKNILEQAFDYYLIRDTNPQLHTSIHSPDAVDQYFKIVDSLDENVTYNNTIIFYPLQNNLEQPMHPTTAKILEEYYYAPEILSNTIQLYYPKTLDLFQEKSENLEILPANTSISAIDYDTNFTYAGGWSFQESWGRWSEGKKSTIIIKVDKETTGLKISGGFFIPEGLEQEVTISINGIPLFHENVTENYKELKIPFPVEILTQLEENPLLVIDFYFPNATSPRELNLSGDERVIALALYQISTLGEDISNISLDAETSRPSAKREITTILPNQTIQIDGSQDESTIVLSNWSHQEPWGRWSEGSQATLIIKPDKTVQGVTLVGSYFTPENYVQNVKISVNNSFLFEINSNEGHEIRIEFPQEVQNTFNGNRYIDITLDFPNAVAPSTVIENSVDNRPLAFGLASVKTF